MVYITMTAVVGAAILTAPTATMGAVAIRVTTALVRTVMVVVIAMVMVEPLSKG